MYNDIHVVGHVLFVSVKALAALRKNWKVEIWSFGQTIAGQNRQLEEVRIALVIVVGYAC